MSAKFKVNTNYIRKNILNIREKTRKKIILVVKAEAYGLGYGLICFLDDVVDSYAVASIEEAVEVKKYTFKKVLILSPVCGADVLIDEQIVYSLSSYEQLLEYKKNHINNINIALKINTGLNRYGFSFDEDFKKILHKVHEYISGLVVDMYSHLYASTSEIHAQAATKLQYDRLISAINNSGLKNINFHYTDSSALLINSELTHMTDIRTGMAAFGINPIQSQSVFFPYKFPVLISCFPVYKIRIEKGMYYGYEKIALDNMCLLTIAVGYSDGIRRSWIGENIMYCKFGKLRLVDTSMNSSIMQVSEAVFDQVKLFETLITIVSEQGELEKLSSLAGITIEDVLCGFNSINFRKEYF